MLGENLKTLRKQKGYSQETLAELLASGEINHIVSGENDQS